MTDTGSLIAALKSTSIDVPRRTDGRNTEHTEKWSICRLLATLSHNNRLTFPLTVQHVDKPGFILEMNKNKYGIEVTESILPDYAKCCAMAERENPEAVIDMSLFKWGNPRKTTEELREIINCSELTGDGWSGNSPEIEWAHYINDAISTKLYKLNNAGYVELPENWIYIYDNLPLPNIHATRATNVLLSEFSDNWKGDRVLTHIFIERCPIIIDIFDGKACNYEISDLWP